MPPSAKRRKTTNGSVPASSRRTTRSQKPVLSIEMVGKVASFANYGRDLMNICKAVGRKDCTVIRHACLRNNLNYLQRTLENYVKDWSTVDQRKVEILSWMEVNTDWRKHCTYERANVELISASSDGDGEAHVEAVLGGFQLRRVPGDQRSYDFNPLVLFNNPTLVIEIGLVDILKHLVEVIGIDVNAYLWNGYLSSDKFHLLGIAMRNDKSCFDYLISRDELDVCSLALSMDAARNLFGGADIADIESRSQLWQFAIADMKICVSSSFESFVQHHSFDPNMPMIVGSTSFPPLLQAFSYFTAGEMGRYIFSEISAKELSDIKIAKFKALLDAGADPSLDSGDGAPIEAATDWLEQLLEGDDSEGARIGVKMIELMRENVANRNT